jgi:hypothetical protein
MSSYSAPLIRGFSVLGIGAALALGHIMFATAAPAPARMIAEAPAAVRAADVDGSASIAQRTSPSHSCYSDQQIVKSVRGRWMLLRTLECD